MSIWMTRILLAVLLAVSAFGQETALDPASSFKINFPQDSPVTLVSFDLGGSKATVRGGALALDLNSGLLLRNSSGKRIRGVTLLVLAQDFSPGGRGSVAVPAVDVAPGENFPVRIDLRMLRPLAAGNGPLVQVLLDGVLFEDLSFFGENRLNSRRSLTVWELEARRDRKHFQQLLEARGAEALQRELVASVGRLQERPRLDVQISRRGRLPRPAGAPATVYEPEHAVQFSFLRLPDAPIELTGGAAKVSGNEAKAPSIDIVNKQSKAIRHLELGWVVGTRDGAEFLAGTLPADVQLAANGKTTVLDEAALRLTSRTGSRVVIDNLVGFAHAVEFADGQLWIPSRAALEDPRLARLLPPSPEEQRLVELYRKYGLKALLADLRK
jgi:hypothetical protein